MSALDTPVDNFAEWVGRKNREADTAGGSMGPTTILATVSSTLVAGLPSVALFDRPDLVPIVATPRGYRPIPGDLVAVTRSRLGYAIVNVMSGSAGPAAAGLTLLNGWVWYHDAVQTSSGTLFSPPIAYRTSAGQVMVDGLLRAGGSVAGTAMAAGTVILTLPAWARPLSDIPFNAWIGSGTLHTGVIVKTNGDIVIETAQAAGALISLSNIRYNNDAQLARTALTLTPPWVNYGVGAYGATEPAQYALDAVGRTILEGLVKSTSSSGAVTTLPAPARWTGGGALWLAFANLSANRFMRVDNPVQPGTGGVFNPSNSVAVGALSLHQSFIRDAFASLYYPLSYSTGGNYGGNWNTLAIAKLADGAVKLKGLIGGAAWSLSSLAGMAPKYTLIFAAEYQDTPGRVDVSPSALMSGAAGSFTSVEGIEWMPAQYTP